MLNPQQNKKLLQKLSHCLEVFEPYLFEPQGKLDYRMFETREHLRAVPPDECFHAPVPHWGGPWQTCWFKGRYQPSEQLAGRALYLMPRVGGYEAMLWVDGMPKGTFATKIVVTRHGNHYCDMLCAQADPARSMDVALEFYAGHPVPGRAPFEPDGPLGGEDAEPACSIPWPRCTGRCTSPHRPWTVRPGWRACARRAPSWPPRWPAATATAHPARLCWGIPTWTPPGFGQLLRPCEKMRAPSQTSSV